MEEKVPLYKVTINPTSKDVCLCKWDDVLENYTVLRRLKGTTVSADYFNITVKTMFFLSNVDITKLKLKKTDSKIDRLRAYFE